MPSQRLERAEEEKNPFSLLYKPELENCELFLYEEENSHFTVSVEGGRSKSRGEFYGEQT